MFYCIVCVQINVLPARCQAHEQQIISLRDQVKKLEAANEMLQNEKREVCSRLVEYEQGYVELLAAMDKMKVANEEIKAVNREEHVSMVDNQQLYDLEARLKTSEADKAVAQHDAERLQHNLDALEAVLHQFQVDNKAQKKRVVTVEAELERTKRELQACRPLLESNEGATNDLELVMEKLAKKTQECEKFREVRGLLLF